MHKYQPFYRESFALVIGINDYIHVNKLEIAREDAKSVSECLISDFGFAKDKVKTLLDGKATRANIMTAFLAYESLAHDDRVIVFFAGHGDTVSGQRGDIGYLIPVDGNPDDKSTLIRWSELTTNADIIPAKHILFIMDACYSGLAINRGAKAGTQRFVTNMLQRISRQVITAGKADEPVSDGGGPTGKNSIFTGHLLEGMRGKAADQNGVITANGLMNYVYRKVADDPKSNQTPHYGHVHGDGDFILQTPKSVHLSSGTGDDFLVEVLPEKPEQQPELAAVEVTPVFASRNGYSDPTSPIFGINEWTRKLGSVNYTTGDQREATPASHWLALVAEPISNLKIDADLPRLLSRLKDQPIKGQKPFENFRIPSQSITTSKSVIFYDSEFGSGGAADEIWKRFMRIEHQGCIEYCDYVGAARIAALNRRGSDEGSSRNVFFYTQVIGLAWKFMFAVKSILQAENYESGVRITVNLVRAKDAILTEFARGEGPNGEMWRQPFDMQALMGGSLNWCCRDENFQSEFQLSLGSLREAESKKLIVKLAQQLGLAFNHQSEPRCFNMGTEIFPWGQFNPMIA